MTSTIKVDNIAPSAGGTEFSLTRGVAKAWVNFNGTGTVAIRDSENVSSITDNGTGNYTTNIANAFGSANFAPHVSHSNNSLGTSFNQCGTAPSSASAIGAAIYTGSSYIDQLNVMIIAQGDLA